VPVSSRPTTASTMASSSAAPVLNDMAFLL
jgi:glycerol dehydrogenase-like iron-containing ADH family enzyme